ncbi:hypothetical protein [Lysinibacillus sp. FN11]|uniref:hypothetical protein n=1 Tax=Lysinibacillus sp. FN11 TaxID=2968499 RepID=UPI00214C4838|nr:hypothetical protein [Lysinibacillus sp. FN11]UUV26838.1 hypothetical protein NP781_09760 [Lysinibacillus sp. FN11]
MRYPVLVLSVVFLLAGCREEVQKEPVPAPTPSVEDKQPVEQDQTSLLSYFPPDGSVASFQGKEMNLLASH